MMMDIEWVWAVRCMDSSVQIALARFFVETAK